MDDKSISLELGDNRVLDFKRTSKTKFFKNGEEVKSPNFNPGDQISVEGPEEADGYMTAVNVYWEKAASAAAPTPRVRPRRTRRKEPRHLGKDDQGRRKAIRAAREAGSLRRV